MTPMLSRVSKFIIALFLLIGTVLCSVPPVAAWYCEGKQCGITLWACCCTTPTNGDGKCKTPVAAPKNDSARNTVFCASGCSCTVVVTAAPDCDHAPPPAVLAFDPFPGLAILPGPVVAYVPPVLTETGVRWIESRGPPTRRTAHASHGFRAPPAA